MAFDCLTRIGRSLVSVLAISLSVGCAGTSETGEGVDLAATVPAGSGIDDLVLVDCLLPGQIRQLGTRMTFLAPRRTVKSTKADCAIRGGEFVLFDRSDYSGALAALKPKADAGDATAQNYVGEIYEKGLGLAGPDYAQAALWYKRAADQGFSAAQTNLGSLHERGLGVTKDASKALDLYRRAVGLTADRLVFESAVRSREQAFHREITVRRQVASALRSRLTRVASASSAPSVRTASRIPTVSASKIAGSAGLAATVTVAPNAGPKNAEAQKLSFTTKDDEALRRQVESQRRDAESEAEHRRKELHALEQIKQSDAGLASRGADAGKSAQVGKLELTRNEEYRALLDTSRQLSFVPK